MDKKSPDVRYICRISGWGFKHLAVWGWFRHQAQKYGTVQQLFQSPRGVGVVQTVDRWSGISPSAEFQSPRGEGVVQTANPRASMVMRQTGI